MQIIKNLESENEDKESKKENKEKIETPASQTEPASSASADGSHGGGRNDAGRQKPEKKPEINKRKTQAIVKNKPKPQKTKTKTPLRQPAGGGKKSAIPYCCLKTLLKEKPLVNPVK